MAIKGIFYVEAFVSDLAASKQFYGETLGWQLHTDEPGVAGFYFGTGYLVILEDRRSEEEHRYGGGMHVEVQVEALDQEYDRLKNAGIEVSEIEVRPWGERNFNFSDPDGYQWAYGEMS